MRKTFPGDSEEARDLRFTMVCSQLQGRGLRDTSVLDAFRSVPRHLFCPVGTPLEATYADHPLSIGHGQTISQPYMVAERWANAVCLRSAFRRLLFCRARASTPVFCRCVGYDRGNAVLCSWVVACLGRWGYSLRHRVGVRRVVLARHAGGWRNGPVYCCSVTLEEENL